MPCDIVILDLFAEDRYIVTNVVVTTAYRNTVTQRVASIPGNAAKYSEDSKLLGNRTSTQPIASSHVGPHVLVPFAIEDGGSLGVHAFALLKSLGDCGSRERPVNPLCSSRPCIFALHVGLPMGPTMTTSYVHLASLSQLQARHE